MPVRRGATMTAEGAFLSAIHDEPDEVAHRLAIDDWLEENGDPARAQWVRVEVWRGRAVYHREPEAALLDAHAEYLHVAHGDRLRVAIVGRYRSAPYRSGFG